MPSCLCCGGPLSGDGGPLCPECQAEFPAESTRCERCGLLLALGAAGLCPYSDHPDGCFAPGEVAACPELR